MPKLRLGAKIIKPDGKPGGIKSLGPVTAKFVEEPQLVMGKNFEGTPRQEFKFIVEVEGKKYRWMVPLLNRQGDPNYLLERTAEINVGDVRVLEMMSHGAAKYIDIRKEGEAAVAPEGEEIDYEDEDAEMLARALKDENEKLP